MEFREANPEDAEAIRRVARTAWHAVHDQIIGEEGVEKLLEKWYTIEGLEQSIAREDAPMVLAVADDEVIGFAQGHPTEEGPADAIVGRIYVDPRHWGEGGGTELLTRLFDSLRADGCESVWLAVMDGNDVGRSFYEKNGFETHEKRTVELVGQSVEDRVLVQEL